MTTRRSQVRKEGRKEKKEERKIGEDRNENYEMKVEEVAKTEVDDKMNNWKGKVSNIIDKSRMYIIINNR